ncbi:secretion protein snm4 [Streptomyces sp. CT34]|uniref:secretion protein snm4 n=1 Tax=Streptomyces sp. CT34 TaxID=1553907 RepID=UPI001F52A0C9|nr:secretion protein snm4 [Streptomyces sp. CT34]
MSAATGQRGSSRPAPATAPAGRDLTGDAADPLDVHGWGWGEPGRTWTAVAASVLLAAVAGVCAGSWYGNGGAARWLGGVAVVAAGAGAALAASARRTGRSAPGTALLLSGGTLGAVAAWQAAPAGAARLAAVGLTAAAVLALLGLCTGLGRGGLTGAAALGLAVGAWEAGLALAGPTPTGAAVGFLSVLALGALPRLALTAAGLTRLDDRHSGGTPVSRHQVAAALGATHRGLAPATVAMAASAGAAGVLVAGDGGIWAQLTAVLLSVVLFSRARAYPLVIEVVALLAAGAAVCVRLVLRCATAGGAPGLALAALCVLAAVPVVALAVRVPEPLRARLWHWLDLVESVSMVALIPMGLGACGLYGLLWGGP